MRIEDKLQEIENRLRNASEGRWEMVLQGEPTLYGVHSNSDESGVYEIADCPQGEDDALLIACAPDDLRFLIDHIRATGREEEGKVEPS